ncbi:PREDICTED: trypsin-like [Priapulus caudatus]|uniref:Trypsin-like n=1 Tax=Priapulus caudatus TaxID=37621 RepID=A0ABM1E5U3_PRICU|nr:PREDICTED: trypsin-like [Priapulus caudatus]
MDTWTEALSHNVPVDILFLDYSKTFDTVPHVRLCKQIEAFGIKGNLISWIKVFLTDYDDSKIVDGTEVVAGEVPWQVILYRLSSLLCGGSLISDRHVLTAAHCVHPDEDQPGYYSVRMGTLNQNSGGITRYITRIIKHGAYSANDIYNDVAVLELNAPVVFTNNVQPIALASNDADKYVDWPSTTSGFGDISYNGPTSPVLLKADQVIVSAQTCISYYGSSVQPAGMICSGQGKETPCSGDSGGPLWVTENGQPTLVGVTSWSIGGCQVAGYPAVYARVTYYYPWIMDAVATLSP